MPFSRPAEPTLSLSLGGHAEGGAEHSAKRAAVPETPLQRGVRRRSRSVLQSAAPLWGAWHDRIVIRLRKIDRIVGRSANAAAPHVVTESLGRLPFLPCARHLLRRGRRERESRLGRPRKRHFFCHQHRSEAILEPFWGCFGASWLGRPRKRHFLCHRHRSEAILEPFWGRLGASLGRLGAMRRPSWGLWGPSWSSLGASVARSAYLAQADTKYWPKV